jgi:hypothetical protein
MGLPGQDPIADYRVPWPGVRPGGSGGGMVLAAGGGVPCGLAGFPLLSAWLHPATQSSVTIAVNTNARRALIMVKVYMMARRAMQKQLRPAVGRAKRGSRVDGREGGGGPAAGGGA